MPLQAVLQQTPSVQNPLWQALLAVHADPVCSGVMHRPLLQTSPAAQFALDEQVVKHAPALHVYGAHSNCVVPALQLPAPSQAVALERVDPLQNAGPLQAVPAGAFDTPHTPLIQVRGWHAFVTPQSAAETHWGTVHPLNAPP